MTELPFPLEGRTLIVGASNAGKTWLTARSLEAWVTTHGSEGVAVLDFGPEVQRDGRILGGRLVRETTVPDDVWYRAIEAHAPRATGETDAESVALAAENTRRASEVFEAVPEGVRAGFVNDATIPFQHEASDPTSLFEAFSGAECVVANAFEGDELGTEDPVSRNERRALASLREWADRVVPLDQPT